MNVVQLGRMMQIMGLILTVKPENKNVSYTIPLSSDFIEFIGLQTSSDQEIISAIFSEDGFGIPERVKKNILESALEKMLLLIKSNNKLYNYSFAGPNDKFGSRGRTVQINKIPSMLTGGFEQCLLIQNPKLDSNNNIVPEKTIDLSMQKELITDRGIIRILKKRARQVLDVALLEQILQSIKKHPAEQVYEVILG